MTLPVHCYGIIPARYASTRFPGKPLTDILGKPMFWHVYQRALESGCFKSIALATDDSRIQSAALDLHLPVIMTRTDHPSGTDRVLEAARQLNVPDTAVVVNIQGDEPALNPAILQELLAPFSNPLIQVTSPAVMITAKEAKNPDQVKVVFSKTNDALYFSRSPIPFDRDGQDPEYYGHIGLYAFRMASLEHFVRLGKSHLENIEKLEQLRLLENNIPIRMVITRHRTQGVDRPEDLELVRALLTKKTD
ncbi:MAG: 3-deoxy-manno-octulosonate cytidylyltransferase [Proteobacteria bacterium]|nr:3-deoxy-manno-octulosonate cytidylyltransferase [Pseudomonadota bacterium]